MEKVKVTKEVAGALAGALAKFDGNVGGLLETHARTKVEVGVNWHSFLFAGTNAPLDALSTDEMARALYIGYEIEKSPKEQFLKSYQAHKRNVSFYNGPCRYGPLDKCESEQERYSSGYVGGVKDFADAYGIKIEGVNA